MEEGGGGLAWFVVRCGGVGAMLVVGLCGECGAAPLRAEDGACNSQQEPREPDSGGRTRCRLHFTIKMATFEGLSSYCCPTLNASGVSEVRRRRKRSFSCIVYVDVGGQERHFHVLF